jgi:hypothetical protein
MVFYPGNYAAFAQKLDQIDVVLAEHINSLQAEMLAMQQVFGLNPQGDAVTVGDRITALEGGGVSLDGNDSIGGTKTFTGPVTFTKPVRIDTGQVLDDIAGSTGPIQIGNASGENIVIDQKRVQARNNGAAAPLNLQPYGGIVNIGANRALTTADAGAGNGLNADKLDGLDAIAFAPAGHKHAQNFCEVYRGTAFNVAAGTDESDWRDIVFTNQKVHYKESGADMYTMGNGRFYTPPEVGPALYYFGVRLAFNRSNRDGTRRLRFIDSNGVIIDMTAEDADLMSKDFVSLAGMYYFPGASNYYVKAQVYQDAGVTVPIYANSNTRPFAATWAAVMRGLN